MNKPLRHTFKQTDWVVSDDAVHPNLSGSSVHVLGRIFAPKREAYREMLLEMRTRLRWSEEFAAAVLGVPLITLRRWEDGTRNPSGAARKLIWLMHGSLLDGPRKAYNAWDCATWGTVDCRIPSLLKPLGVSRTVTMSREELHRQVEENFADEQRQAAESADSGQPQ